MRKGSIIGLMAAVAMAGIGYGMAPVMAERPAVLEANPAPVVKRRREARSNAAFWSQVHFPRKSRTQRHTGAGGAGMHTAWKKRRAAGRA